MDDIELTRLCAEAMGYTHGTGYKGIPGTEDIVWYDAGKDNGGIRAYDPLYDDAQAMALVKKFKLLITPIHNQRLADTGQVWIVTNYLGQTKGGGSLGCSAEDVTLNRAIVECVAKMQERKP